MVFIKYRSRHTTHGTTRGSVPTWLPLEVRSDKKPCKLIEHHKDDSHASGEFNSSASRSMMMQLLTSQGRRTRFTLFASKALDAIYDLKPKQAANGETRLDTGLKPNQMTSDDSTDVTIVEAMENGEQISEIAAYVTGSGRLRKKPVWFDEQVYDKVKVRQKNRKITEKLDRPTEQVQTSEQASSNVLDGFTEEIGIPQTEEPAQEDCILGIVTSVRTATIKKRKFAKLYRPTQQVETSKQASYDVTDGSTKEIGRHQTGEPVQEDGLGTVTSIRTEEIGRH